ncbi:hypothetical protein MHYP_G00151400 [Metynnis hypsauchen]
MRSGESRSCWEYTSGAGIQRSERKEEQKRLKDKGVGLGPLVPVKGTLNVSAEQEILDNFMLQLCGNSLGIAPSCSNMTVHNGMSLTHGCWSPLDSPWAQVILQGKGDRWKRYPQQEPGSPLDQHLSSAMMAALMTSFTRIVSYATFIFI